MSKDYESLKREISDIAEVVSKFPDSLQNSVFKILVDGYFGREPASPPMATPQASTDDVPDEKGVDVRRPVATPRNSEGRRKAATTSPKLLKDLDVYAGGEVPAFVDFVAQKDPQSDREFNTVAVYYLTVLKEMTGVGQDHLFTCYREAKRALPADMISSIKGTTRSSCGYLSKEPQGLIVSNRGTNFVEKELPRRIAGGSR